MNPAVSASPVEDIVGDRRWMDMHERFVEEAQTIKTDLLFLGDSITLFWKQSEEWKLYFKPLGALNFGVGGDATQHLLWRIQNGELEPLNPKVIVLLIGTNNFTQQHSNEQVCEGIITIVKYIIEHKPHTKILLLGILPRGHRPSPVREKVEKINESVRLLASEFPAVQYQDVGYLFLNKDGILSSEDMHDYLHLTHLGYSKLSKVVHESVTQMLK